MSKFKNFMKAVIEEGDRINARDAQKKEQRITQKAAKKNRATNKCPRCGETRGWQLVGQTNKGFSGKKAVAGGLILGPIGIAGGALGKKKQTYLCQSCGFQHEYDK